MAFKDHFQISEVAALENPDRKKVWVNFLPNIDFGHLLTMVGFAVTVMVGWNSFDKRLTLLEQQNQLMASQLVDARVTNKETLQEVKTDMKTVKDAVITIQSNQALAAYKLEQMKVK